MKPLNTQNALKVFGLWLAALALAAPAARGASEMHAAQVFYRDVTVAAWGPTVTVASISATNGGAFAATGTWHYAVAAQNSQGKTTNGPVTNVVLTSTGFYVRVVWPSVGGATNYLLYRGSTATNLTNYVNVAAQGVTNFYLDYGTNTFTTGFASNTITEVPWLTLPDSNYTPTNNDAVRARDVAALDISNVYTRAQADAAFVNTNETNSVTSQMITDGTVVGPDLGTNAVTSQKITDYTIRGEDIGSNQIPAAALATNAVTTGNLDSSVGALFLNATSADTMSASLTITNGDLTIRDTNGTSKIVIGNGGSAKKQRVEIYGTRTGGGGPYGYNGLRIQSAHTNAVFFDVSLGSYADAIGDPLVAFDGPSLILSGLAMTNVHVQSQVVLTTNGWWFINGGDAGTHAGMYFTDVSGTDLRLRINPDAVSPDPVFQVGTNSFRVDADGNVTVTSVWMRVARGRSNDQPVTVEQMVASNALLQARPTNVWSLFYSDADSNLVPLALGQVGATIIFQGSNTAPVIGLLTATATNVASSNLTDVSVSGLQSNDFLRWNLTQWVPAHPTQVTFGFALNADKLDGFDSAAFQLYLGAVTNNGGYLRGWTNGTWSWESITASATDVVDTTVQMTHSPTGYSAGAATLVAHARGIDTALGGKAGVSHAHSGNDLSNGTVRAIKLLATNAPLAAAKKVWTSTDGGTNGYWGDDDNSGAADLSALSNGIINVGAVATNAASLAAWGATNPIVLAFGAGNTATVLRADTLLGRPFRADLTSTPASITFEGSWPTNEIADAFVSIQKGTNSLTLVGATIIDSGRASSTNVFPSSTNRTEVLFHKALGEAKFYSIQMVP